MGLLDIFWKNPTRDWPDHARGDLDITLQPLSINGVRFGGDPEDLRAIGRPDATLLRKKGIYYYRESGFTVEIQDGVISQVWVVFSEAYMKNLAPASALNVMTPSGRQVLRPGLTQADIERMFGPPVTVDADDFGGDLTYEGPGYELAFELSEGRTLDCCGVIRRV